MTSRFLAALAALVLALPSAALARDTDDWLGSQSFGGRGGAVFTPFWDSAPATRPQPAPAPRRRRSHPQG